MAKPKRNLLFIIVPCAVLAGWFALGDSLFSQKAQSEQTKLGVSQKKNTRLNSEA